MAGKSLNVNIKIDGLRETIRAFSQLPKDANNELRLASLELSKDIAGKAATAGRAEGRQAALVAATVKARRDRVPVVVAGGRKRLGRNKVPASKLVFGSEFGATRLKQYKPHVGKGSYWFFKTVTDNRKEISDAWNKAADEIVRKYGRR
jgi:hypothetical protein